MKNSKLEIASTLAGTDKVPASRTIAVDAHRIDSADLFVGTREITIGHGNEVYRLRLTSQNKLILTK